MLRQRRFLALLANDPAEARRQGGMPLYNTNQQVTLPRPE